MFNVMIDIYGFLPGISPELLDILSRTSGPNHPGSEEMSETVRGKFFFKPPAGS